MNTENPAERRRYTRIPWKKKVTLFSDKEALSTEIIDISLKGALLKKPKDSKIQPGDLYRLSIPLENAQAIIMNIAVIHVNDQVFGAEWTQIDMDSFASLKRTIELNIEEKTRLRDDIKKLSE